MQTLKGTKKELIKEYNNFCNDFSIDKNILTTTLFAQQFIENQVKNYGIFNNKNFKIFDTVKIQNEIEKILDNYLTYKLIKKFERLEV